MEKSIQEIRILNGLQAGASLALSPGKYLIGTGEQCDIVLNDRQMMDEHAYLIIDEQMITIQGEDGGVFTLTGERHESNISLGTLFRLGNTWLVIDDATNVWPDMEMIFAEMQPAKVSVPDPVSYDHHEDRVEEDEDEDEEPGFSDLDGLDERDKEQDAASIHLLSPPSAKLDSPQNRLAPPPLSWLQARGLKSLLTVIVLGIAVLCVILAFIPTAPDKALLIKQTTNNNQRRIEQLLQDMHLKQRVNVLENNQGKLVVTGYLAKTADMTALIDAFNKLKVRPELRLFSEEAIMAAVNQVLLTAQLPIKANNLGMGRIQLIGAAAGYENVDTLIQKLNTSIDGLRGIDSEILVGDQLVAKLRQMIVDQGLAGKVTLVLNKGEAIVNGALDLREMTQWEQLMAQFVATYGSVLPIRASFPPTATMLPFKVLSAFSGDMPFIVTNTGEKVMLGGRIQGYTLINITEQEIVFDGPRKVQIQR